MEIVDGAAHACTHCCTAKESLLVCYDRVTWYTSFWRLMFFFLKMSRLLDSKSSEKIIPLFLVFNMKYVVYLRP